MVWIRSTRCCGKSPYRSHLERKINFTTLSDLEKRQRALELWKTLRLNLGRVRDPTFHLKDQPLDDLELFQKTEWFQIDPNKSSALFLWTCLLFVVFVFDMIQTPLFIVWPDLFDHLHFLIWFCDFVWAFNIPIRFLSVDYSIESSDPFDIMWNYIGGEFLVDLAATFPSIISGHSVETHILRLLH